MRRKKAKPAEVLEMLDEGRKWLARECQTWAHATQQQARLEESMLRAMAAVIEAMLPRLRKLPTTQSHCGVEDGQTGVAKCLKTLASCESTQNSLSKMCVNQ